VRWLHRLYAKVFRYFWIPCPICGKMFGGHEAMKNGGVLWVSEHRGKCVCKNCKEIAKEKSVAKSYGR